MSTAATAPIHTTDEINARILAVSEDRIQGFQTDPLGEISRQSGVDVPTVIERIRAMLRAGTIRRVRQTLMSINLAAGGLIAWVIPEDRLNAGFEFMFHDDPFSGHIVIRSTDKETTGSKYRLWTTLKVPRGYSMEKHCRLLCTKTGATAFKIRGWYLLMVLASLTNGSRRHRRAQAIQPPSRARASASSTAWKIARSCSLSR